MDAEDEFFVFHYGSTGAPMGILHNYRRLPYPAVRHHDVGLDPASEASLRTWRISAGSPATPTSSTGRWSWYAYSPST